MNLKHFFFIATLCLYASTASATEYIYRDLMANTLASPQCKTKDQSIKAASSDGRVKRYAKKFCQTQGYGWHLNEIKDKGKPVCNSCSDNGTFKCNLEDVVVQCKRIKPGSVGMLPGKG